MLEVKDISKQYQTGSLITKALDHVSVAFRDNEFVAILGPSGSGKTTLLNVIGGLDQYDSGDLIINSVSTKKYKDKDWDSYRNHTIGFVFQSYNLIMHQSVLQNVELALTISNASNADKKKRALEALDKVGLKEHAHKKPNQLSGGQMQRVAIARALVNNPDIILADEPTGALDSKTSVQIMDLLKEVAKDKLVIMVTHNPELANEYASRIVSVRDGKIIDDTNPLDTSSVEIIEKKTPKVKLGWPTALALSFNNLMTKKGRTILTAFAGAIGIIGIALILSLSTGVNDYIKEMETQMLGSYPIQLTKEALNLGSHVQEKTSSSTKKDKNVEGKVVSKNIVGDSINTTENMIVSNDLSAFKTYLESHYKDIKEAVSAIEYEYDVEPQVYREDDKEGLITVSPANLMESSSMSSYMNPMMEKMQTSIGGSGVSATWQQLVSDKKLRESHYELLEGKWPSQYNEIALVVSEDGDISDYYLYQLGLLDYSEMLDIMDKASNNKDYKTDEAVLDYKDILNKEYKVFAPSQLYKQDSSGQYINKNDDNQFIKSQLSKATTVKITCVLKANKDAEINSGIGYDASLTTHLIKKTGESDVVKAQLAKPEVNVLTGEKFEKKTSKTLKTSTAEVTYIPTFFDKVKTTLQYLTNSGITLVDQDDQAISDMAAFQSTKKTLTKSGYIYELYGWQNTTTLDVVPNEKFVTFYNDTSDTTYTGTYKAVYVIKQSIISTDVSNMTPEQQQQFIALIMQDMSPDVMKGIVEQYTKNNPSASISEEDQKKMVEEYMKSSEGQAMMAKYFQSEEGQALMKPYMEQYMQANMAQMDMNALMSQYSTTVDKDALIKEYMASIDQEAMMKQYMANIDQDAMMKQYMANMDMSELITSDMISKIMAQYSSDAPTTYSEMLDYLGYVTEDQPSSINLYPIDFDSKEIIEDFISTYNNKVDDTQKVTYTDIIKTITSSITSIVDTITAVLVAFVAISLVVSSIMISIITYISVLERTKEIGVLRALGTSKKGITRIFNAETFIEGLISGVAAILVTLLLSIPINRVVENMTDVPNICHLPMTSAIVLILISVMLTLIAGFFPASMAAKKDPVIALRSE